MTVPGGDRIELKLTLCEGRVAVVGIAPRHPVAIGQFALGRDGNAVVALVPRLFALCAQAQRAAATTALAEARGHPLPLALNASLASAVVAERMVELLRGSITALAGERLAALAPGLRDVIAASHRIDQAGLVDFDAIAAIERGLAALGLPEGCFDTLDDGRRWLTSSSVLAAIHCEVLTANASFAATALDPITAADDREVGEQLLRQGSSFASRPDLGGRIPETGALARNAVHPLVASWGTGLGGRLLARLIEIRNTPGLLRALHDRDGIGEIIAGRRLGDGIGLVAIECARGRLYQLVILDRHERVSRFEILAPTEWNFHPRGALVRALTGIALSNQARDVGRVKRLVAAFDPCVAFGVSIAEAADA
jgi:uptake hydrogenase large subunit